MNKPIAILIFVLTAGCASPNKSVEISYIKGGQTFSEKIDVEQLLGESGKIKTEYIKKLTFENIESVCFTDDNPDKISFMSTPLELDFTKPVLKYTPEYYAIATAYYIDKCVMYYNSVFDNKIMFCYCFDRILNV